MKIIWTDFAIENLKDIYDYYASNTNRKVARKILNQILKSTKQLVKNPESGQLEIYLLKTKQNHRYLVSRNYKIIYRIFENQILINDVFDTRQDPTKINEEQRKNNP